MRQFNETASIGASAFSKLSKGFVLGSAVAAAWSLPALAAPEGASVVAGDVNIARQGGLTTIHASDGSIINYQSFNIGVNEAVRFVQPGSDARVLNRITGLAPTHIDGALLANGQVYIVNPYGVYFGPTAVVQTSAIYAAAASISNRDFLAHIDRFTDVKGDVANAGHIYAQKVALIGQHVSNSGTIVAPEGTVMMLAGDEVLLGQKGGRIFTRVTPDAGPKSGVGVSNTGEIRAPRGRVALGAGDMYSTAIFNSGGVKAADVRMEGGKSGVVRVSGKIDATNEAGRGGEVRILGERVALNAATVDASGATGGGEILVGGNFQGKGAEKNADRTWIGADVTLRADATLNGDGGRIIVWSDTVTRFHGSISVRGGRDGGDGGFVEVSGKEFLTYQGMTDASAPKGRMGTLLLDPTDIFIRTGGTGFTALNEVDEFSDPDSGDNAIDPSVIVGSGVDVVLQATRDVIFENNVVRSAGGDNDRSITVQAGRNIVVNSGVTVQTRGGNISFTAADPASGGPDPNGGITLQANATLDTSGGNRTGGAISLVIGSGSGVITINTSNTLQTISGAVTLSGPVRLGAALSIDTSNQNNTDGGQINLSGASISATGAGFGVALDSRGTGTGTHAPILLGAFTSAGGSFVNGVTANAGTQNITINGDVVSRTGGTGITFSSPVVINAGGVDLNAADATLTFSSTVTQGGFSLFLTGNEINTGGAISGAGQLTLRPGAAGRNIRLNAADNSDANALNITATELGHIGSTHAILAFGRSDLAGGTLSIDAATTFANATSTSLIVGAGGSIAINNAVGTSSTAALIFTGNATMSADVTTNSTDGGNITFSGGTLTLAGGNRSIVAGPGSTIALGAVNQASLGLTVRADEIDLTGLFTNPGAVTLRPFTSTQEIRVGFATDAGGTFLDLLDTDLANLGAGHSLITIGHTSLDAGLTINAPLTFSSSVTFVTDTGGASANISIGPSGNAGEQLRLSGTGNFTFTAPAIEVGADIEADSGSITFNGPVTLSNIFALSIRANGTGSTLAFNDTLDQAFRPLTLRGGEINFADTVSNRAAIVLTQGGAAQNMVIGAADNSGASLDITNDELTRLGVFTSGAAMTYGRTDGTGIVSITTPATFSPTGNSTFRSAAAGHIAVNQEMDVTGAVTLTFSGPVRLSNNILSDASLSFTGVTLVGADRAITVRGAGNTAAFAGAMDLAGFGLTVTADEIDINSGFSSAGTPGTLRLRPFATGNDINFGAAADAGAGTLDITSAEIARFGALFSQVILGNSAAGTGNINITTSTNPSVDAPFVFTNSAGTIAVAPGGELRASGAGAFQFERPTTLNANIVTQGGAVAFTGAAPVTINAGTVLIDTTNGGGTPAGAAISFGSTVNSTATAGNNLTLRAGTGGNIALTGAAGGAVDGELGTLAITSANNVNAAAITAGAITQSAGAGTGAYSGALTVPGAMSFTGNAFTFGGGVGSGSFAAVHSGVLGVNSSFNVASFSSSGTGSVNLGGNITSSTFISIAPTSTITIAGVTLTGGGGAGDNINLGAVLRGAGASNLTLIAGAAGNVSTGALGTAGDALGDVLISSAATTSVSGSSFVSSFTQSAGTTTTLGNLAATTGAIDVTSGTINLASTLRTNSQLLRLNGAVNLTGDTTLDSTNNGGSAGAAINVVGNLDSQSAGVGGLTFRAGTGAATFGGTIGAGQGLGGFTDVAGSGSTSFTTATAIRTSGGAIALNRSIALTNNMLLNATAGGSGGAGITLNASITGDNATTLTVTGGSAGDVTVNGALTALGSFVSTGNAFTLGSAGSVVVNNSGISIDHLGDIDLSGTLDAGTSGVGSTISVRGERSININNGASFTAGGATTPNGVNPPTTPILIHASDTSSGGFDLTFSGNSIFRASGITLRAGNGPGAPTDAAINTFGAFLNIANAAGNAAPDAFVFRSDGSIDGSNAPGSANFFPPTTAMEYWIISDDGGLTGTFDLGDAAFFLGGVLSLTGDTVLSTEGSLTFLSPIQTNGRNFQIEANRLITFNGAVTTTGGGTLALGTNNVARDMVVGATSVTAFDALYVLQSSINQIGNGFSEVRFGNAAGSGRLIIPTTGELVFPAAPSDTLTLINPTTFIMAGGPGAASSIIANRIIRTSDANEGLTFNSGTRNLTVAADAAFRTNGNGISIIGNLVVAKNSFIIDTTNNGNFPAGGLISLTGGTAGSDGVSTRTLTLRSGNGNINPGDFDTADRLAMVVFDGNVVLTADRMVAAIDSITFNGTIDSDGTGRDLSVDAELVTFNGSIGTTSRLDDFRSLSTVAGARTDINAAEVLVDNSAVFSNAVRTLRSTTIDSTSILTFESTINAAAANVVDRGLTLISDAVTLNGNVGTLANGRVGALTVSGGTTTLLLTNLSASQATFNTPLLIGADVLIDTAGGNGDTTFNGTINTTGSPFDLNVSARTTTFNASVGTDLGTLLRDLIIAGSPNGQAAFGDQATQVRVGRNLGLNNPVELADNAAFTFSTVGSGGLIGFRRNVTGDSSLTVVTPADGLIELGDTGILPVNVVFSTGALTFSGPVRLVGSATLTAPSVNFNSTINSQPTAQSLTVNAANTAFNADIGGVIALAQLTTDGAGTTLINTDLVRAGRLFFNDSLVLTPPSGTINFTFAGSAANQAFFNGSMEPGAAGVNVNFNFPFLALRGNAGAADRFDTFTVTGGPGFVTEITGATFRANTFAFNAPVFVDDGAHLVDAINTVTFNSTLDAIEGSFGARLDVASSAGNILLNSDVGLGAASRLFSLALSTPGGRTIARASTIRVGGDAAGADAGGLTVNGLLEIEGGADPSTLQLSAIGNIALNEVVGTGAAGRRSLNISTARLVTLGGNIGVGADAAARLGVFSIGAATPAELAIDATVRANEAAFGELRSASGGARSLTVDAPIRSTFAGVVGGGVGADPRPLAALDVVSAAIRVAGASINTVGDQSFNGVLEFGADTAFRGSNIALLNGGNSVGDGLFGPTFLTPSGGTVQLLGNYGTGPDGGLRALLIERQDITDRSQAASGVNITSVTLNGTVRARDFIEIGGPLLVSGNVVLDQFGSGVGSQGIFLRGTATQTLPGSRLAFFSGVPSIISPTGDPNTNANAIKINLQDFAGNTAPMLVDEIFFGPDISGAVPTVSSILVGTGFRLDGSLPFNETILSLGPTPNLEIIATSRFEMFPGQKLTAFGNLTIQGQGGARIPTAILGDLTALGDLIVRADSITFNSRAPRGVLGPANIIDKNAQVAYTEAVGGLGTDRNTDVVARSILLDGAVFGADTVSFATFSGQVNGAIGSRPTAELFGNLLDWNANFPILFRDRRPDGNLNNFLGLDFASNAVVQTNVAGALAGSLPSQDSPVFIDTSPSFTAAEREALSRIGIRVRDDARDMRRIVALGAADEAAATPGAARQVFDDTPRTERVSLRSFQPYEIRVSAARLDGKRTRLVLNKSNTLLFQPVQVRDDAGNILELERREALRASFGESWRRFAEQVAATGREVQPEKFRDYLIATPDEAVSRGALAELDSLLFDVRRLGLSDYEASFPVDFIINELKPDDVESFEVWKSAVTGQPASRTTARAW